LLIFLFPAIIFAQTSKMHPGISHVNNLYVEDRTGDKKSYSESEFSALGFNTQLTVSSECAELCRR
jgi:hypothetical protein